MLLVALLGFAAIALLAYAVLTRPAPAARRRLGELSLGRPRLSARDDERPSRGEALRQWLREALPGQMRDQLAKALYAAGIGLDPETALILWALVGAGLPLVILLELNASKTGLDGRGVLAAGAMAIAALYGPVVLVRARARSRRNRLLRAMPDMMDLLTTCVEAGLGIDAALARVAEKVREPLRTELRRTIGSVAIGRSRRQALQDMAVRNGVPDLSSFVTAVVQSETVGSSLGETLRVQAEVVRVAQKQRAEQAAQKAPIKIIFVLALLLFPTMFAVILGPAVIGFVQRGGLL
ncbi:MAG TPA: type II secretion system F family protein [Dehalococcoidia bacterium]|nr:type II secretion system F family protein [Dehalococcoidia bacterium]